MVQDTPVPIVMVGSQRSSDRPSSDAALNLIHATKTAAEIAHRDPECCNGNSISVIGKALSGQKFVADLSCMPSRDDDRRYIVFVRERGGSRAPDEHAASVAA